MIWILIVALFISYAIWMYWQSSVRTKAVELLNESDGTFDENAYRAIKYLDRIHNPTPRDNFMYGRIIDLNAHEGRINNKKVLKNVVSRYMTNLRRDNNFEEDLDWFELDQIENFAARHMDIMTANPHYNNFIEAVLEKRPTKVKKTIDQARDDASNKKEAIETYVESNKSFTTDSQNVHDSSVNENLRKCLAYIKVSTPNVEDFEKLKKEISSHISTYVHNEVKRKNAMASMEQMLSDRYNSTLNILERDLLGLVWNRGSVSINYDRKELIRNAIVDSLIDMKSGEGIVCSSGRCSRLLESLVYTDADEKSIVGSMTVEQIRNEALQSTSQILQECIKMYEKSSDPILSSVARSYTDPSIVTNEEGEKKFKKIVSQNVEKSIIENFAAKLSDRDNKNILQHCLTVIDSI